MDFKLKFTTSNLVSDPFDAVPGGCSNNATHHERNMTISFGISRKSIHMYVMSRQESNFAIISALDQGDWRVERRRGARSRGLRKGVKVNAGITHAKRKT